MEIAERDIKVLSRFVNGGVVRNNEEEMVLEEYRKIGWVNAGMRVSQLGDAVMITPTASLTSSGRHFVRREKIFRSRWKKYFYKILL